MDQNLSVDGRWQFERFCRQYLQLQPDLDYPDERHLRKDAFQENLYSKLFDESVIRHPPPPKTYQLRVLKELMKRVERSIQDWEEEGISDNLMMHLSTLMSSPLPSEAASALQKSYVTYTLSCEEHQASLRLVPVVPVKSPSTITLLESRNVLAASGTTGLRTWEASLHLGNYLLTQRPLVHSKRILELGSGTGYLSILCSKHLDASHVLATDGSEEVVSSLSTNFFLNGFQDDRRIQGKELRWGHALLGGEQPEWNDGRGVDLVIGADVTYDTAVIPLLVATFRDLFEIYPGMTILIAATVRNPATFEAFLKTCRVNQFGVKDIDFPIVPAKAQKGPFYSDQVPIKLSQITRDSQAAQYTQSC